MNHVSGWTSCDRCTAQALFVATKGIAVLDFCGHHLADLEMTLIEHGWYISESVEGSTKQCVSNEVAIGTEYFDDGTPIPDEPFPAPPIYRDIERSFEPGGENYSG